MRLLPIATSEMFNLTKCSTRQIVSKYWKTLVLQQKRYNSDYNSSVKGSINILGIETSCDDTGTAIVNERGQILGEGYYSQAKISVKFGGVVPAVAKKYHEKYIEAAVNEAFHKSGLTPQGITAVAATVKPGNIQSLRVGAEYGKRLALEHALPFIPIHHMEAHALTARIDNQIPFPFVALLVSGGHCVLALCHDVDRWSIVGEATDAPPGCVIDRISRRLKLRNVPRLSEMSGGPAMEAAASGADPRRFPMPPATMSKHRDANFSFSGFEAAARTHIERLEKEQGLEGGRVLAEASDLCAAVQYSVVNHIVRRTHRGLAFLEKTGRISGEHKTLVVSGGVACNSFLRSSLSLLCSSEGYRLVSPRPSLCTDNGVMIAWNGVERWRAGRRGVIEDPDQIRGVDVHHKCPLGDSLASEHRKLDLANPTWVKILPAKSKEEATT